MAEGRLLSTGAVSGSVRRAAVQIVVHDADGIRGEGDPAIAVQSQAAVQHVADIFGIRDAQRDQRGRHMSGHPLNHDADLQVLVVKPGRCPASRCA